MEQWSACPVLIYSSSERKTNLCLLPVNRKDPNNNTICPIHFQDQVDGVQLRLGTTTNQSIVDRSKVYNSDPDAALALFDQCGDLAHSRSLRLLFQASKDELNKLQVTASELKDKDEQIAQLTQKNIEFQSQLNNLILQFQRIELDKNNLLKQTERLQVTLSKCDSTKKQLEIEFKNRLAKQQSDSDLARQQYESDIQRLKAGVLDCNNEKKKFQDGFIEAQRAAIQAQQERDACNQLSIDSSKQLSACTIDNKNIQQRLSIREKEVQELQNQLSQIEQQSNQRIKESQSTLQQYDDEKSLLENRIQTLENELRACSSITRVKRVTDTDNQLPDSKRRKTVYALDKIPETTQTQIDRSGRQIDPYRQFTDEQRSRQREISGFGEMMGPQPETNSIFGSTQNGNDQQPMFTFAPQST